MSGIFSHEQVIAAKHNPELAKQPGHVYQVWEDGEITLQKCGDLLWQRSLHSIYPGDPTRAVDPALFPMRHGPHGYAFTTKWDALRIRATILGTCWTCGYSPCIRREDADECLGKAAYEAEKGGA